MWGNTVGRIKTPRRRYDGIEAISSRVISFSLSLSLSPRFCLALPTRRPTSSSLLVALTNARVHGGARFFPLAHSCLYIGRQKIKERTFAQLSIDAAAPHGESARRHRDRLSAADDDGGRGTVAFHGDRWGEGRRVTDINVMPG